MLTAKCLLNLYNFRLDWFPELVPQPNPIDQQKHTHTLSHLKAPAPAQRPRGESEENRMSPRPSDPQIFCACKCEVSLESNVILLWGFPLSLHHRPVDGFLSVRGYFVAGGVRKCHTLSKRTKNKRKSRQINATTLRRQKCLARRLCVKYKQFHQRAQQGTTFWEMYDRNISKASFRADWIVNGLDPQNFKGRQVRIPAASFADNATHNPLVT